MEILNLLNESVIIETMKKQNSKMYFENLFQLYQKK